MDDLLPHLIFQQVIVACSTEHPRLQDLTLFEKQLIQFKSQLFGRIMSHIHLSTVAKSQAALRRSSDLHVSINTDADSDFDTIAATPSDLVASVHSSGVAQYIISGTRGIVLCNTRAASRPPMTGIERSSTIKSGCSREAASIASRPFSAIPQT